MSASNVDIYRAFLEAKVSEETARRAADAFAGGSHVTTEIQSGLQEIRHQIGAVDSRLTKVEERVIQLDTKIDLRFAAADLRTEKRFGTLENNQKWMLGIGAVMTTLLTGIVGLLARSQFF